MTAWLNSKGEPFYAEQCPDGTIRIIHPGSNQADGHADDRAVWYYSGRADKRNGRPCAVDLADTSELGWLYLTGYRSV